MTLGFKTQINSKLTYFIEKIWFGLIKKQISSLTEYQKHVIAHEHFFLKHWDDWMWPPDDIGFKLHTIREDKNNLWGEGRLIHPVINNRTADRFQFAPVLKCVSVQRIEIT